MRGSKTLLAGGFLALALAGCGQGDQAREGQESSKTRTEEGRPATTEQTRAATTAKATAAKGEQPVQGATGGGEVAVGGFSIEGSGGSETTVPQVSVEREAAESGDPDRVRDTIRQSLPRIERFNDLTTGIVQDLEQAAGTQ